MLAFFFFFHAFALVQMNADLEKSGDVCSSLLVWDYSL